jgi:glycosyltransferase involved in cell wall biosynthesis
MRIGIDGEVFRWPPTGIYNYLWNLLDGMGRLGQPHQFTLFLYGQPWVIEPHRLRELNQAFPKVDVQFYWDRLTPLFLSSRIKSPSPHVTRWVRRIDRRLLVPLWRRLVIPGPLTSWLPYGAPPSARVDLFHHPYGVLFPLHHQTNVMTIHDLIPCRHPEYCAGEVVESFESTTAHVDRMDVLITPSECTKHDVVEAFGVEPDRIRVIPHGIREWFHPLPDRDQVRSVLTRYRLAGRPYILNIATLAPHKNVTRLVEAVGQLTREDPSLDRQLVLVGTKGWKWESIFKTVRRCRLEDRVRWLGYVPLNDLPALLNGADLFAFPSLYEGFGFPPLEAMACGTPVVASRASSLPEVVGDAGLLVDPFQVGDMAAAMHRVLTDGRLRATLRDKGLARARLFT